MREYIFDDWGSVWHSILGFILGVLSKKYYWFVLIMTVVYIVYQCLEKERPVSTVGDIVEFLVGYVLGLSF